MTVIVEEQVAELLDMPSAVDEVESALRAWAAGRLLAAPRIRVEYRSATLHVLPGIVELDDDIWAGQKSYLSARAGTGHKVVLHRLSDGSSFVIEATLLGAIRTGAVSAVATRYLHGPVRTLAVIGAGQQARQQIRAIAETNAVERVQVFSRTPERTNRLVRDLDAELDTVVVAAESPSACLAEADTICTITRSATPVFDTCDLVAGAHINAVGSNALDRQEIPEQLVRESFLVVDSREQAATEAGDLASLIDAGALQLEDVPELADVVVGRSNPPRAGTTLFESLGVGVLDLALARLIIRRFEGAL